MYQVRRIINVSFKISIICTYSRYSYIHHPYIHLNTLEICKILLPTTTKKNFRFRETNLSENIFIIYMQCMYICMYVCMYINIQCMYLYLPKLSSEIHTAVACCLFYLHWNWTKSYPKISFTPCKMWNSNMNVVSNA